MKKTISVLTSLLLAAALLIGVTNCKKDNPTFELSTMVAGSIDLNGASSATDVPSNPTIVATFNLDVDAASVTNAVLTLIRDYDDVAINLTITVAGKTVTIVPDEGLGNGSLYKLSFLAGIKATDGQLLTAFDRTFTTEGNFAPSGVVAYWNFNDTPNEQINGTAPLASIDLAYADSYTTDAGKAGSFNGTTSIVEFANGSQLMNVPNFTLSFWVKALSAGHVNAAGDPKGHFVMGLGAYHGFQFEITGDYSWCKLAATYNVGDTDSFFRDIEFKGDGIYNINTGYMGFTYCKDLTGSGGVAALLKDTWAHVVCVYDGPTKIGTMYINGEKMFSQDFNLYIDDPVIPHATGLHYGGTAPEVLDELAFGFLQSRGGTLWDTEPWGGYDYPTSNHFGGLLDDVRIFHKALTPTEVDLMYQSEKP